MYHKLQALVIVPFIGVKELELSVNTVQEFNLLIKKEQQVGDSHLII